MWHAGACQQAIILIILVISALQAKLLSWHKKCILFIMKFRHLMVVLALSVQSSLTAALISYSESANGELGFLTTTFTLDTAGTNSISGSSSFTGAGFDNDSFFFNLDPSLKITGVVFNLGNGIQSNVDFRPQIELATTSPITYLGGKYYNIGTGIFTSIASSAPFPYSYSSYRVYLGGSTFGTPIAGYSANFDWQISVTTASTSVPESGVTALFLLGAFCALAAFPSKLKAS